MFGQATRSEQPSITLTTPPPVYVDPETLTSGIRPIPMPLPDKMRLQAAANQAKRLYPGPAGEMIARELVAYAEFGFRVGPGSLVGRLVEELLAIPSEARAS